MGKLRILDEKGLSGFVCQSLERMLKSIFPQGVPPEIQKRIDREEAALMTSSNTYVDVKYVDGEKIEYQIIFGNEKIVFIKAGADGSVRGQENKYLKMARRVHERMGATVICASNPNVQHEELDEAEIRWIIAQKGLCDFEISFIGASDGAYHNLSLAKRFPETVKWMGINCSYITIPRLQQQLLALPGVHKRLVYGTKDDDFNEIIPTIRKITSDKLVLKFVPGADHNFTGMTNEWIALADDC